MEEKETPIRPANDSRLSSAVQLVDSGELFRPYSFEPAPEDDKDFKKVVPPKSVPTGLAGDREQEKP